MRIYPHYRNIIIITVAATLYFFGLWITLESVEFPQKIIIAGLGPIIGMIYGFVISIIFPPIRFK